MHEKQGDKLKCQFYKEQSLVYLAKLIFFFPFEVIQNNLL